MNRSLLELLVCPSCRSSELELEAYEEREGAVVEGRMCCAKCRSWYRIESELPDLLPNDLSDPTRRRAFALRHGLAGGLEVDRTSVSDNLNSQREFFKSHRDEYERRVVHSPYYRVLDDVKFDGWVRARLARGQLALEVGCGSGRQSLPLLRRGLRTVGVDVSEEMLALAREKVAAEGFTQTADFVLGAAERLPFRDEVFDALVFYGALHHVDRPDVAITQAAACLAPGGRFYILEPHASPVRFLFDLLMRLWHLYDEESNADVLFRKSDVLEWLGATSRDMSFELSTFLPPHVWYLVPRSMGRLLLRVTDRAFGALPGASELGGVLIATGSKTGTTDAETPRSSVDRRPRS